MSKTIDELETKLLEEVIKEACQRAYNEGLADARSINSLPQMLRKKDIAEYFQTSIANVENIIRMDGFPHSKVARARYPRDKFIEWANTNIDRVNRLRQAN
ncbi:hypothetical protein [Oceanobacillus kimchii]|uniref:hypothetical protein n=1 Tax=Oceanobacillus kimchii TaxID=746691 RepID=UPI003B02020F